MTNVILTVTAILLGRNIEPYVIMDECASRLVFACSTWYEYY